MKTLQPYPQAHNLLSWILWHLRNNRDVVLEFRGPKGFGKSATMFHLIKKLAYHYNWKLSLCYSHRQYVDVVKRLRRLRQQEDQAGKPRSVQIVWMDDATRLLNRRDHSTKKNKRLLDLMRTSRNQIQAVHLLGTQDDLVERPMMEIGPYLLMLYRQPYVAEICWPKVDPFMKKETVWVPKYPYKAPDPKVYQDWPSYQDAQRKLTDELTKETLKSLAPRAADPAYYERILKRRREGLTFNEIAELEGKSAWAINLAYQKATQQEA